MTDPAGGAPTPPNPGNWQAPPPPPATGGFQQSPVEPGPAPGISYADTVTRVIALVIDAVILGAIQFLLVIIGAAIVIAGAGWLIGLLFAVLWAVVSVGYFVYTWTSMRASPGQRVMHLETVNAADGATMTQEQAIRRWAFLLGPSALSSIVGNLPVVGLLGSLIGLASFVYALYLLYSVTQSPKRQGFHDLQAGTVVVRHG